ncbi:MAG: RHS repeat-associated core domain-containing protein, partial [Pseudomonadota bacterium]|nr:RHS repeat-associated core domain-containing protein [Pseudomonadota bacterium]
HLGTSAYITHTNGQVYQHLEYFPFGETWVEEHSNKQRTPYLFTAKELDEASQLYYFGARYYDPRTSVWQSPDPILESYLPSAGASSNDNLAGMGGVYNSLNLALYAYSHLNPVNLLDPDGNETVDDSEAFYREIMGDYTARDQLRAQFAAGNEAAETVGDTLCSATVACGATEAITGEAGASGRDLSVWERVLSAIPFVGAGKYAKNKLNDLIDLTGHRKEHILNRHRAGAGKPGKTEFPANWNDDQILHNVSDVATDPNSVRGVGKWDSPYAIGTRDGIEIRVDFYPDNHPKYAGQISTAYPINGTPNP